MIKVVVAGATGFIGQWLCKALIDKGITIVGIGRNEEIIRQLESYGGGENKGKFNGIKLSFEGFNKKHNMAVVILENHHEINEISIDDIGRKILALPTIARSRNRRN